MTKVFVTGANGYIGSHVVKALCDAGAEVVACDFQSGRIDGRAEFRAVDVLARAADADLFRDAGNPDAVVHLAWSDGFNHGADGHLNNLPRHYAFVKNMIDAGVKSVSVMGTMHEIGYWDGEVNAATPCNPMSLYGIAKNALRQAVLTYAKGKAVSVKWLRAFYITGDDAANHSVFAKILQMAQEGKTSFPFTTGENKYDFEDIRTLARQIAAASVQNEIGGIINVCSGRPVSLKEKVEEFIAKNGLNIRPEYGAFPSRPYDSPCLYGNADLIAKIMKEV